MRNFNLNPGGVIGAILCLAAVIAIAIAGGGNIGARIGRFGVIAVFVGALGGNALWRLVFSSERSR